MSRKRTYGYQFQYIVVGEIGIGKTCLLLQFTTQKFSTSYEMTVGIDFGTKMVDIDRSTRLKLQICDTSGQEAFQSITRSYYRSAIVALLVYDITSMETFQRLDFWMDKLRVDGQDELVIMLVGNKCDLEHERQVPTTKGKQYAAANGLYAFIETSAKTAHNVNEAFIRPAKQLLYRIQQNAVDLNDQSIQGITVGPDKRPQTVSFDNVYTEQAKSGCSCQLL